MSQLSKADRTAMFFKRLEKAPLCSSSGEAFSLVCNTLNEIEDQFTSVPYNPANWENDGRLYPPDEDAKRSVPEHPEITRYRHRKHSTWIAKNGAIKITEGLVTCLEKPGSDGMTVTSLMDSTVSKL